jgi:UDP-N-acetylmuramate: L-alanyl-gamma-D-glutamyl-meso-diaminopimelate ligase
MRMGVHRKELVSALRSADKVIIYQSENVAWDLSELQVYTDKIQICMSIGEIVTKLQQEVAAQSHFLIMSNGSFGGIYQRIKSELK